MSKRAVILAGGKGTRLRPYTVVLPKPLMPICEYPILEIIVRQLAHYGFDHITMAVNHQADIIKAYFGHGERWNIKIDYSLEKIPLSTIAPLKYIEDLPDDFLLMNGDILTDLNYESFYNYHIKNNSLFTISSYSREQKSEYGVLQLNNENELIGFMEKPITKYNVSMGIYMLNKEILEYIPRDTFYGFDNLMYDLLKYNKRVLVNKYEGYWLDIGRPDDYMQAIDEYEKMKEKFLK